MIFKLVQIDKYFKKPDLGIKCFVLYGSNEGLIASTAEALVKTVSKDLYDPFATVYLNEIDEGTLASEYNARSLMGGRRVIVIKDADNNLTKGLKNVLDSSNSDTLIVASSSALNKGSSLVKLATDRDDCGLIACYEDREEDIHSFVRASMIEKGVTIVGEALQLLCARLSNDRKANENELEKLITYIGDRKNIVQEDIVAVVSDASSSSADDVCFFVAGGYSDKAQKSFVKLINEGVEPISIVRSVYYHFSKILQCLAHMEGGESIEKAMMKLSPRVIFFRETGFKRQLSIWKRDRVFSVLELLYKCERDCKTTNMPVEEVASYVLMQISNLAAKLSK